jgi:predicted TIM-barrel fold metal-dependent hydrolase
VHIQVGTAAADQVQETAWLSNQDRFPHAIVAACDLASDQRDRELDQHLQFSRLRGIRQILGRHAEEDRKHNSDQLIDAPAFAQGLSRLSTLGLSFDLQLIPPQMQRVARLLASVPDLQVALCHCGSPWDQSVEGLAAWRIGLRALAELPGVVCKVSGLGMFNPSWTVDDLRPIVHEVVGTFGPERVMFGSNFPVDKLYRSYEATWSAYEALLEEFSGAERESMLVGTAASFYRLG